MYCNISNAFSNISNHLSGGGGVEKTTNQSLVHTCGIGFGFPTRLTLVKGEEGGIAPQKWAVCHVKPC